ncbi:MAG: hypothetical protein JKX81_16625 [Arenicella sp.]|nr:hypothetical protein [Arenicella sp.]
MTDSNSITAEQLRDALYGWAVQHAVLADDAMREAMGLGGDARLIPFDDSIAAYFRVRKIIKIGLSRKGSIGKLSLATRLPIARAKRVRLIAEFGKLYAANNIILEVCVEKPFKIDQSIQSTFKPVYFHNHKISCGSSIGLGNQRNAGTLTALGQNERGELLGISCNHVTGGCNTASVGTPIVSPGIQDVSPENFEISVVGLHDSTGPMSQGLPQVFDISDNCDIAFFDISDRNVVCSQQGEGIGSYDTPVTFANAKEDLRVKKWGRSTGLTHGEITKVVTQPESVDYNVISYYGPTSSQTFKGTVYFAKIYEVESLSINAFSAGGDSGSLVVTDQAGRERIVGILIGGNNVKSYVLPIQEILKKRKITIIGRHNV